MKTCYSFLICFSIYIGYSQNLVPNPSFEFFTDCPSGIIGGGNEINKAYPWSTPTKASPDYFHKCNGLTAGVPGNTMGYQEARTGKGYAGCIWANPVDFLMGNPGWREYIQIPLKEPLQIGREYCVSFYISLADERWNAVSGPGILFTTNSFYENYTTRISREPQIRYDTAIVIDDKKNWTKISGSFIADSAYTCLTIGNFGTLPVNQGGDFKMEKQPTGTGERAYYYIDDVSVTAVKEIKMTADTCGQVAVFIKADSIDVYSFKWSNGDTTYFSVFVNSGTYDVIVTDRNGCHSYDTFDIQIKEVTIEMPVIIDPCIIYDEQSVIIDARNKDAEYIWSTGETGSTITVGPGKYLVNIYVLFNNDTTGCWSKSDTLTVKLCEDSPIYIPNAFSQNGDGQNDWFTILTETTKAIELKIFNVFGKLLFESTDVEKVWDGSYRGIKVQESVVIYYLQITNMKNEILSYRGNITLIR